MTVKKLAVFCSGNGSNFEAIMQAVRRGKIRAEIAVMVCDNPKAHAIERAKKHDIPVVVLPSKIFQDRKAHEKVLVSILKNQGVDLVVLAGYMRIFTPFFIRAFRGRLINIHPSYLPAFKGANAIKDAFEAKVSETGVTVHEVVAKVDAGPIILQQKISISKKDTLKSLERKIHHFEHKLYPLAIEKILSKASSREAKRRGI